MKGAGSRYSTLPVTLCSTALALVILNLVALPFVDDASAVRLGEEQIDRLALVYPGLTREEIPRLIAETRSRPYTYEPFTQFRERPYSGRYIQVEAAGYRRSEPQAAWPPAPGVRTLFVFGGSTTFGYGLPDAATLPSQIGRGLAGAGCPTAVYNFARSNYYSTQERILFQQLAASGAVPTHALFVDGLNEFFHLDDRPKFTARFEYLMDETGLQITRRALKRLPVVRVLRSWLPRQDADDGGHWPDSRAEPLVERWLTNRRLTAALAAELGVSALFVWQPVPAYGYDLEHHLFADSPGRLQGAKGLIERGYRLMAGRRPALAGPEFLWLADLQLGRAEPLYVDQFHYSEAFTGEIAGHIAATLLPALCPKEPEEDGG